VVQALNLMAVLNPRISHVAIDGALFQDEVEERQGHGGADGLPQRRAVRPGPHELEQIVAKLDTGAAARAKPRRSRPRSPSTC
jgi:alkyl hydroperoxide reductase subunit F